MEKIIEIDLMEENDLLERYNRKRVSSDLINYIIESASNFTKKDVVKMVINNNIKREVQCVNIIIEGLKNEYNKKLKKYSRNNIIQLIYFFVGIILLSFSSIIQIDVLREVILISGWVMIWEVVELEIFSDMENRKKRRILKKILNSEIIEKKIKKDE